MFRCIVAILFVPGSIRVVEPTARAQCINVSESRREELAMPGADLNILPDWQ